MQMPSELPAYLMQDESCTSDLHALVPGSYDPVTVGHKSIIEMASKRFKKVTAAVFVNAEKEYLLSISEKTELLQTACRDLPNVRVTFDVGMLYEYCRQNGIDVIVKGVRNEKDFEYECRMAKFNFEQCGVKTLLLPADLQVQHVSSSLVKQKLLQGESVSEFLPQGVEEPFLNMLLQQL